MQEDLAGETKLLWLSVFPMVTWRRMTSSTWDVNDREAAVLSVTEKADN